MRQRQRDDVGQFRRWAAGDLLLSSRDIDLVIMQRVQGRGGGRGHPGGVRAGAGMGDFLRHHVSHAVGRGPHALADLGAAGQPPSQARVDVVVLVGRDPRCRLHVVLAHDGSRLHAGVDFIARAVEKARVDVGDPVARRVNAGGEVDRRAALLVHNADLDGIARKASQILGAGEGLVGQRHLVGPMHLRPDDVDRALARVLQRADAFQVVQRDHRRDRAIDDALGNLPAVGAHDHVGEHVVADIARQHQASAGQPQGLTIRTRVFAVGVEAALDLTAIFLKGRGERALH